MSRLKITITNDDGKVIEEHVIEELGVTDQQLAGFVMEVIAVQWAIDPIDE